MGLFDKKQCSICGNDIGLLGNRKLADGNLCKNCAAKLSPFFSDRRESTVEQIRQQLAYREENERNLSSFQPTRVIDGSTKIYVDEAQGKFIITSRTDWRSGNPDIIALSQVRSADLNVKENKSEEYKDPAKHESYEPKRYKYEYVFNMKLLVDAPYFDDIAFEVKDGSRSHEKDDEIYVGLMNRAYEIQHLLYPAMYEEKTYEPEKKEEAAATTDDGKVEGVIPNGKWRCSCGHLNDADANFCSKCGTAKTIKWYCPQCGKENTGNFCVSCGTKKPEDVVAKTITPRPDRGMSQL